MSLSIETEAEEGEGQTQKAEEEGDLRWMKRDIVPQVHPRLAGTHHWVRAGGGRALSGNRDSKSSLVKQELNPMELLQRGGT